MIETQQIYSGEQVRIRDLTSFGWQKTQEILEQHGRLHTHYQIMARDTNMPNYSKIKSIEDEYEQDRSHLKTYIPMDMVTLLVLLLLFVLPGIIYFAYKMYQKSCIEENNNHYRTKMESCMRTAREIMGEKEN